MSPFKSLLALTLICSLLVPGLQAAPPQRREVQLLVKPKARMPEAALHAQLSAHGGRQHKLIPALNVRVIRVPEQAAQKLLEALQEHHDVEYAELDHTAQALSVADDPYHSDGSEWHLNLIAAPAAWEISTGSADVAVAVIDTGVTASHPDLQGKVLAGYDFVANDSDASDEHGHGTSVAGLIGASTNNSIGMAAVAWANPILPVRVLDASGSGSYSAIISGITWAADNGARIINLSLGGTYSSQALQDAVDYAWNKKAVIIAAAGNNGNDVAFFPAACRNVVAVSATTSTDVRPGWSNFGTYVDLAAPGESVLTLYGAESYAYRSGTSFASPIAAGVAALMASVNPQLSNTTIVDLLLTNSDDIGEAGYDVYFGQGRVNAWRAVTAAKEFIPPDTTLPLVAFQSPTDSSIVSGAVAISVNASDNVGVTRLELYVDGVLAYSANSPAEVFPWNTKDVLDGSHLLEARVYDSANNVGTAKIAVTVQNSVVADKVAPTVAIISPVQGAKITGTKTVNVAIKAADNVRVTKVELYVNGKLSGTSNSATPTFSWDTSKTAKGAHTLQAYAADAAGNVTASLKLTVTK